MLLEMSYHQGIFNVDSMICFRSFFGVCSQMSTAGLTSYGAPGLYEPTIPPTLCVCTTMLEYLMVPGSLCGNLIKTQIKAATRNFHFVLIWAAPLNKSGSVSQNKDFP